MRPTRVFAVTVVVVAGLIGPAANKAHAGGGGGGAACDGFSLDDEVVMRDSCFEGTAQLVNRDAAVIDIRNQGDLPHTLTATDGSFHLHLDPGETGTVDLPDAVVTPVYCTLHGTSSGQGMAGVIVRVGTDVGEASAAGARSLQPGVATSTDQAGAPADADGGGSVFVIALVASTAAVLSIVTAAPLITRRRRARA